MTGYEAPLRFLRRSWQSQRLHGSKNEAVGEADLVGIYIDPVLLIIWGGVLISTCTAIGMAARFSGIFTVERR